MLWSCEATRFVEMLRLKNVGFAPEEVVLTSLTSCSLSSVTNPESLMYGAKERMNPTSRDFTVVVVTGGFVLLCSVEFTTGIWSATLIFAFFPLVAMTLGEERTDAFPSFARDRNAAVSRPVFATR